MAFCNFGSFSYSFNAYKRPLTVWTRCSDRNSHNNLGDGIKSVPKAIHVTEPIFTNNNPNLTYTNDYGGQQSTVSKIWESYSIKDAPRGTIVETSKGHKYKTVGSTQVTGTNLWYYQLKEVGGRA